MDSIVNLLETLTTKPVFLELSPQSKRPIASGWTKAPAHYATEVFQLAQTKSSNIGLLLGERSGLFDVDADCKEAVALASVLLPSAKAHFSRSADSAHYIYCCNASEKTKQYQHDGTLIELRGTGGQTMIPPSVHPNGDLMAFAKICPDECIYEWEYLETLCGLIAASAVVARYWEKGVRHNLALGFSGLCRKAGFSQDQVNAVLVTISELRHDGELEDRLNCAASTYGTDSPAGFSILSEVLGKETAEKVSKWLGLGVYKHNTLSPTAPSGIGIYANSRIEMTERRMAEQFTDSVTQRAVYVYELSSWFVWENNRWNRDVTNRMLGLFHEYVEVVIQQPGASWNDLKQFESLAKAKNVLELSQHRLSKSLADFDTDSWSFGCSNGLLNLKTGVLADHRPDHYTLMRSSVKFQPDASCTVFDQFIRQVFDGDEALVEYVQKCVGYSLCGSTKEQSLFLMIGEGANGKSTFVNILNDLFGDYSKTAASWTLVQSNRNSVGDDLIHLIGARFISMSETEQGQKLAEAKVKQMTGGDTISGRKLYGEQFDFQIHGKIFLASNLKPEIHGGGHGIWRRINVIPFNRIFSKEEQDTELLGKLKRESSGILNWALEGFNKWLRDGLQQPESVKLAVSEYMDEMDDVAQFVSEECELQNPSSEVKAQKLYEAYKDWCHSLRRTPKSNKLFKKSLLAIHGIGERRTSSGVMYTGIAPASIDLT